MKGIPMNLMKTLVRVFTPRVSTASSAAPETLTTTVEMTDQVDRYEDKRHNTLLPYKEYDNKE